MRRVALLVAAGLSLGCAGRPGGTALAPEAPGDPAEYAPFMVEGDAIIEGRAFVRTRHGGTHYAQYFPVYLDPVTSYSRRLHERGAWAVDPDSPALDTLFVRARQEATPVEEGKFTFAGLAPGWYYVSTLVIWDDGSVIPQSFVLRDSVRAQPGRTVTVVLTRVR